jgi:hypothetical protein
MRSAKWPGRLSPDVRSLSPHSVDASCPQQSEFHGSAEAYLREGFEDPRV